MHIIIREIYQIGIITKSRNTLISRITLLLILGIIGIHSVQGQESTVAKIPSPDEVQLQVVESGHPWQPPFGVDRVGRSSDVIVTIQSIELPAGEFLLFGYLHGTEVSRPIIQLINKTPFTGILPGGEDANRLSLYFSGNQAFTDNIVAIFTGRITITANTDQLALFFVGSGMDTVELAQKEAILLSFEAEAVARPDKVINPVELGDKTLTPDKYA